jgi:hypothetical protein
LHWTGKRCSRCRILDQGDVVEPLTGAYHHSKANQRDCTAVSNGSVMALSLSRLLER